jgi:hypothetical protein
MAGGLCPSPVAVEGSARLTVFSQRGLHVSIPFRGDLPVIIGERDVAVVSPVALTPRLAPWGLQIGYRLRKKLFNLTLCATSLLAFRKTKGVLKLAIFQVVLMEGMNRGCWSKGIASRIAV